MNNKTGDEFYAGLADDEVIVLRPLASQINARLADIDNAIFDVGFMLLDTQKQYPGRFMEWCQKTINRDYTTLVNYMNVARIYGDEHRRHLFQSGKPGAFYELARKGNETIRGMAEQLIGDGEYIDGDVVTILKKAPSYVVDKYMSRDLLKNTAKELTDVLTEHSDDEQFYNDMVRWQVTDPANVRILNHSKSTGGGTYQAITENNGVLDVESGAIPLSRASAGDLEQYMKERQHQHIVANSKYLSVEITVVFDENGNPTINGLPMVNGSPKLKNTVVRGFIKYKE